MSAIKTRATGPLTRRLPRLQSSGDWIVARVDDPYGFEEAILGGYSCDCNGRTLIQINRTTDIDARVQLGATCKVDGNRTYLPYRRMPWMVEDYMIHHEAWYCETCGEEIGTLCMLDGVIVGVELSCPLCMKKHDIDLTLGALPERLRLAAFGIEPPVPLLSPPAYEVLRQMWECIQKQPTNSFVYRPYKVRHDSGQLQHAPTGREFEAASDHIDQLSSANLIEDNDIISISRSGVIVCLREFGGAAA
ncbi:MAG: hypothetical protein R3A46_16530 [Thermomicrobiales bacterium]